MLLVYVSGHGFGHAVRTSIVLSKLQRIRPDLDIEVVTSAPAWLFPSRVRHTHFRTDIGLVQRDGLEHDEDATLVELSSFMEQLPRLAQSEVRRLERAQVELVLGDIPVLAFEVGHRFGVPAIAMGNFSWDDIYLPFLELRPGFARHVDSIRTSYSRAERLLRLPFHLPMSAFRAVTQLPVVARKPTMDRSAARAVLGLPAPATVVLIAFGGFGAPIPDLAALARLKDYLFVIPVPHPTGPVAPNVVEVADHGLLGFPDLLIGCDAVVTKPGYGMVSDLLAYRVPALYLERPRFAEYPILAQGLQEHARALPMPRHDLETGNLHSHLERLLGLTTPWSDIPLNGGEVAARHLSDLLT